MVWTRLRVVAAIAGVVQGLVLVAASTFGVAWVLAHGNQLSFAGLVIIPSAVVLGALFVYFGAGLLVASAALVARPNRAAFRSICVLQALATAAVLFCSIIVPNGETLGLVWVGASLVALVMLALDRAHSVGGSRDRPQLT
jgi:hypothetical protein